MNDERSVHLSKQIDCIDDLAMSENPTNNDQLDEQLTAYLDGELPPAEARRVEDLLAGDDRARKRLNQLASSWDLLDQLPRSAVDEKFARTTVEMVAVSAEKELAEAKAAEPSRRHARWLAAAVIALLAAGVGFTAVSVATPSNNDALLTDLPVIVNLEQYRPVGSIELLRELNKSKSFPGDFRPRFGQPFSDRGDGKKDGRNEPRVEPEKAIVVVPAKIDERREWVAKQSPEEKLELRRNFERFAALAPTEQASLRTLDSELNAATDREELTKMMRRYNDELRRLSPADRGALEDLPVEKKIARIEQRRHERESRVFFQFRGIQDYAMRNEQKLFSQLPAETKAVLQKVKDENQQVRGWNPYYSRLVLEAWRNPKVQLPPLEEPELKPIVAHIRSLAPDSPLRKQLEDKTDPQIIVAVLRAAVQSGSFAREMSPRGWGGGWGGNRWRFDREQFEENLPPEQKKKLDGLKGSERDQKLNEIMREMRGGDRNRFPNDLPRFGPGDGPPGGFGGEPRPDGGQRPDGQRRGGQGREGGPRSPDGSPRGDRDRKGPNGPPPEFRPGEDFKGDFPPPHEEDLRPDREPAKD
jgi:hypothetical protein